MRALTLRRLIGAVAGSVLGIFGAALFCLVLRSAHLDPHTSAAVFENLYELARRTGVAAVVATHNLELARHMDRVLALKDGHLEEQPRN